MEVQNINPNISEQLERVQAADKKEESDLKHFLELQEEELSSPKLQKTEKESQDEGGLPDKEKIANITQAVESYLSATGTDLKFKIDDSAEELQVEVRDPKTQKLIRKIPSDEMLKLAASMEKMVGVFMNKTL